MPRTVPDTINAVVAVIADMITAVLAFYAAVWLRFDSGLFGAPFGRPENPYALYAWLVLVLAAVTYASGRRTKLYRRPQRGTFPAKIPRLFRMAGIVTLTLLVVFGAGNNYIRLWFDYEMSTGVILAFLPCFSALLLLQKGLLFRFEIVSARKETATNAVVIIGADATAGHLMRCFERDPRLRIKVSGVLKIDANETPDATIPPSNIRGVAESFATIIDTIPNVVQVIISNPALDRALMTSIAAECEKRLIRFHIVPDMFFMMTSSVEIETIDDIPLLGIKRSPLDNPWNRLFKRIEDILGALVGLVVSAPIFLVLAVLIKRESRGPVFYSQIRCGYGGKAFSIYKLRSMRVDAESETGAVFAGENDPRRTKIGTRMRKYNLDELPQFWNVLRGDMSLVGPRPERPVFVEQFTGEIGHYMRRHVSRPGITGWAQVHGLRGNTSIEERLTYDLWYLENWSVALDFKILLRTFFAVRNAY